MNASAWYSAGFGPFPTNLDPDKSLKAPFESWAKYQGERMPLPTVEAYLRKGHNLGIIPLVGQAFLDVEGIAVREGVWDEIRANAAANGLIALLDRVLSGYSESSPSGGIHAAWTCPVRQPVEKLAMRPSTAEELEKNPGQSLQTLVEVKGHGGYIVVAPTPGYGLLEGSPGSVAALTAEEQDALLSVVRLSDRTPVAAPRSYSGTKAQGGRIGDDFNAKTTWAEVLEPAGWKYVREGNRGEGQWRRPGKLDAGISATTNATGTDTLLVFSSSTRFELCPRSYDRFGAYAVLYHNGDMRAAASELASKGFASVKPDPDEFFGKGQGLLASKLAASVMAAGPLAHGRDDRMWVYDGGVWVPGDKELRGRVIRLLGDRYRGSYVKTVQDVVIDRTDEVKSEPIPEFINFRNGLLNWRTGVLVPHDPKVMSTVQVPVDWDESATCPAFDKFLSEVLHADSVEFFWEVAGYGLRPGNPLQVAFLLLGSGGNGKSTALGALTALYGQENVSAVSLKDLTDNRFMKADLFGKLANIAGDIDAGYVENTAQFKQITGGDVISAEHKNRDAFTFQSWAVPFFSANKAPGSSDVSDGYLRRWVVVNFPNRFEPVADNRLNVSLTDPAELAGMAVHAVAALRTLVERGTFEYPETVKAAKEEFAQSLDQSREFIAEQCQTGDGLWDSRKMLYASYKGWASGSGHKELGSREFFKRLRQQGYEEKKQGAKAEAERGFAGLRVSEGNRLLFHGGTS